LGGFDPGAIGEGCSIGAWRQRLFRLKALIAALQADRDPAHQQEIYRWFDSELLE
jgi:hypothetical protein